jgi:hypothetical protein
MSRIGLIASKTASVERFAALRSQGLSLAKNCWIGFRPVSISAGKRAGRRPQVWAPESPVS